MPELCLTNLPVFSERETPPVTVVRSAEALMLGYQRGDEGAFRELYLRYRGPLYRFIRRMTRDATLTEEIFQETWMAVVNARARYARDAKFVTWLFAIAHRRTADHWRKRRRQPWNAAPELDDEVTPGAGLAEAPANASTPHGCAENEDLGDALLEALGRLPVAQREAFLLKAEGELTLEEIAEITGVGRETIKSRLRYAVERLRAAMRSWR